VSGAGVGGFSRYSAALRYLAEWCGLTAKFSLQDADSELDFTNEIQKLLCENQDGHCGVSFRSGYLPVK
jgi:hypothetical protein